MASKFGSDQIPGARNPVIDWPSILLQKKYFAQLSAVFGSKKYFAQLSEVFGSKWENVEQEKEPNNMWSSFIIILEVFVSTLSIFNAQRTQGMYQEAHYY